MEGNEKFSVGVAKAFGKILVPAIESRKEDVATRMMNHLLDSEIPVANFIEDTAEIRVMRQIVNGTSEIQSAFESLLDVEIYIRRFPYKNTRISKSRHLRYTIENYLNQIYVLKQRLKGFLQVIEELYAKGSRRKEVKRITKPLFKYLSDAFADLVTIRSSHVHKESYTDKELSRLEGLDFTIRASAGMSWHGLFVNFFNFQYKTIRRERADRIKSINKVVETLMDEYYSKLYPVVFDSDGDLIIPE